jgi:hypothetical protein
VAMVVCFTSRARVRSPGAVSGSGHRNASTCWARAANSPCNLRCVRSALLLSFFPFASGQHVHGHDDARVEDGRLEA